MILMLFFCFLAFVGNYSLRTVTNTACTKTLNGHDYISGYRFLGPKSQYNCAMECTNHSWCKGILSGKQYCRLLTDVNSISLSGWQFSGDGNWVEPRLWKNSRVGGYQCLEKIGPGVYLDFD